MATWSEYFTAPPLEFGGSNSCSAADEWRENIGIFAQEISWWQQNDTTEFHESVGDGGAMERIEMG